MTTKAEVIYFPKPCPHCKDPLFRTEAMNMAWSECRNRKCSFLLTQPSKKKTTSGIEWTVDPEPYTECYNRR